MGLLKRVRAMCGRQAGAHVNVYSDGSVVVSHAGVEMGQGLNTKMQQVAAEVLGLPMDRVQIVATSTLTVPNTQPTAASAGAGASAGVVVAE